jgi:hypothetical protein
MIATIFIFAATLLPQPPHVAVVEGSEMSQVTEIVQNGKKLKLHLYDLNVSCPEGETVLLHVFAIYDPKTQLFWWNYVRSNPKRPETLNSLLSDYAAIYETETKFVTFRGGAALAVAESQERYPSMELSLAHVLASFEEKRCRIDAAHLPETYFTVDDSLRKFTERMSAAMIQATLLEVTKNESWQFFGFKITSGSWRLLFETKGEKKRIAVTLNDKYVPIGEELVSSKQ